MVKINRTEVEGVLSSEVSLMGVSEGKNGDIYSKKETDGNSEKVLCSLSPTEGTSRLTLVIGNKEE